MPGRIVDCDNENGPRLQFGPWREEQHGLHANRLLHLNSLLSFVFNDCESQINKRPDCSYTLESCFYHIRSFHQDLVNELRSRGVQIQTDPTVEQRRNELNRA